MKMFLYCVAVLAVAACGAMAQSPVQVVENVRFYSNSVDDPVRVLTFGFGAEYSDSVDFPKGEHILPPFFPPEGLFAFFGIKDRNGSEDFGTIDVRGIPDSVLGGEVENFSLEHIVRINRGFGQEVTIEFPFKLMRGLDSVRFESLQAGANFTHTFTQEGGKVLIPNNFITSFRMTSYYNYNRVLSVPVRADDGSREIRLYPNPVLSGRSVRLAGEIPAGSRVMMVDLYGSVVHSIETIEAGSNPELSLPYLPNGAYMIRVIGEKGETIHHGRLVVTR